MARGKADLAYLFLEDKADGLFVHQVWEQRGARVRVDLKG